MTSQNRTLRTLRIAGLLVLVCTLGWTGNARAQLENLYPGFFGPANPQVLDAILFGGGFGSQDYGAIQEGFQLEQTVTPYIGVVDGSRAINCGSAITSTTRWRRRRSRMRRG